MKKTSKRKTYFKPLFKVNASKCEDAEKQSQLMLENHKRLTDSSTSTTKDGLRRNHTKPKKNQYVLVHSFLDDNDTIENKKEKYTNNKNSGIFTQNFNNNINYINQTDNTNNNNNNNNNDNEDNDKNNINGDDIIFTNTENNNIKKLNVGNNSFDHNIINNKNNHTTTTAASITTINNNYNNDNIKESFKDTIKDTIKDSIKRSASCRSGLSVDFFENESSFSSPPMNNSSSTGLSNLFKKSIKKNSNHNNNNSHNHNHSHSHSHNNHNNHNQQYHDDNNYSSNCDNNLSNNISIDNSISLSKSMDCLSSSIKFDSFISNNSDQTINNSNPDLNNEKQHKVSGFRKFYSRNKTKVKSKNNKSKSKDEELISYDNNNNNNSLIAIPPSSMNLPTLPFEFKSSLNLKSSKKVVTPLQNQSQSVFPIQQYDYFSSVNTLNKSSRNRSTSSSSSFLRQHHQQQQQQQQQQQFLNDESFLNTPSFSGTPNETPLGTPYESFDDAVTPFHTPNTIDDESNLEVFSITTSSTKRFKTLKRSSSIMSLNSSASMQLATPVTTTQGGTPIPASPLVSSISNPNISRSAINIGSNVYPSITTPSIGTRGRMLSCSSNVSIGYSHHVQKSPSNPNIGAKAQQQAQQQIQLQTQQQNQPQFLVKSKSLTPQPQAIMQPFQYHPQYQLQSQSSPIVSQQQQQQVQYKIPNKSIFVEVNPKNNQNNQTSQINKNSINLDRYLDYVDDNKTKNSYENTNSENNKLNICMEKMTQQTTLSSQYRITNSSPSQRYQRSNYQYQNLNTLQTTNNNNSTDNLNLTENPKISPQVEIQMQMQEIQKIQQPIANIQVSRNNNNNINDNNENNDDEFFSLIEKQEQQILSQQLHHNDPQIINTYRKLQSEEEERKELDQLNLLDRSNNPDIQNIQDTEKIENIDSIENLEDLELLETILNSLENPNTDKPKFTNLASDDELDQLINIIRDSN